MAALTGSGTLTSGPGPVTPGGDLIPFPGKAISGTTNALVSFTGGGGGSSFVVPTVGQIWPLGVPVS